MRVAAAIVFFAGASALGQALRTDALACEQSDGPACHRLGVSARDRGDAQGETQAWVLFGRACELGEANACDDAAALARRKGKWMAADAWEQDAQALRANPLPQPASPQTASPQTASPQTASPQTASPQTASPQQATPQQAARDPIDSADLKRCLHGEREACGRLSEASGEEAIRVRVLLTQACQLKVKVACHALTAMGPVEVDPDEAPAVDLDAGVIVEAIEPDAGIPEPRVAEPQRPPEAVPIARPKSTYRNECLSDAEIERNRLVVSTREDLTAFRPSGIWAIPLYLTNAERSYTWAALLYFQSLDFEDKTRTRVVPPFFVSHCAPESQTLVTPFYSYRTDEDGTASLYFTYFRRRDRLLETDVLFPFAYSFRERASEDAPWVGKGAFVPFAFWKRDPNGNQFTLVPPLFFRWGDDVETTTVVGPVFLHEAAERHNLGVVPFYFQGRGKGGDYDVSPLLFWSFRDGPKHSLLLPLLLTWHGGDGQTEATWSFNTWFERRPSGFTFLFAPLLFVGREGGKHHTFLPPLFWRWGDDANEESTTLVGNVYVHTSKLRTDVGVVPLYFHGSSVRDGDYDISPLLFWSFRDGKKHSLFIPPLLAWHSGDGESETTWALNVRYQGRPNGHSLTIFPLLFEGREGKDRHVVVPPLFWLWGDGEETTAIAANVFWHKTSKRSDLGIVPLYFRGRSVDGESYDVSPLFFWSFRDSRTHTLVIPPLLTVHHSQGDTTTTLVANTYLQTRADGFTFRFLPLVFAGREKDKHHVVAPLFARWGDSDETTTIAANVFWRQSRDRLDFGIVPLFFHGPGYDISPLLFWSFREGPKHTLVLPALLSGYHSDGETTSAWVVNTWYQSRPDGFTLSSFPFVFFGREGRDHHEVVAPIFARWGDDTETTTFVGPVYAHEGNGRRHFGLPPLYFGGRSTKGDYDVSPLLFWSYRTGLNHRLVIPPLLTFHEGDGETETTWALNTWYQQRKTGFTLTSFPFLFAGREGSNHHLIVPPVFFRWGDAETTTTIAGPVFWRTAPQRTDFGVVPLYFHGPGYDVSPLLFWSFRDEDTNTLLIPPLLAFYRSRPDGFSLGVLPFIFAGRTGREFHQVVAPLFWRWGDDEEQTTIAANVFFHRNAKQWDFGIAPLFFNGRGARNYDVALPFFWSFREGRKHSLLIPPLLTWYETDGETETAFVLQTYFATRKYGFTLNSFPFLFAGQDGDAFHTVLPPLFWDWGDSKERTTIAGPLYWHWTPLRSDFGIAPLYFGKRSDDDSYDIVPPLFWSNRSPTKWSVLLPAIGTYFSDDGDTQTAWVLNTFYQRRPKGFTFNLVPFVFSKVEGEYSHTFAPPVFWRWGSELERTTIVGNIFWHETLLRKDWGIVPLFFHGTSDRNGTYDISPLLFWSFRDGKDQTLVLPPLLTYHHTDGETSSTWALNTWYQSRPDGFTLASVPLLFLGREGKSHHAVVPPLFFRWGDGETTTTIAGPAYVRTGNRTSHFGFAPLYFGKRSDEGEAWDLIPPLLFYRSATKDTESITMLPFFKYASSPGSKLFVSPLAVYSKEPEHERTVLGGLYWNMTGPDLEARVVAPLWWDFKSKKKGTRLTTVFPLYWRYEKPEETTHLFLNLMVSTGETPLGRSWSFHLFPLIDLVSYHPKHFLWQVLAGLLAHETQAESERWKVGYIWLDPTTRAPR